MAPPTFSLSVRNADLRVIEVFSCFQSIAKV